MTILLNGLKKKVAISAAVVALFAVSGCVSSPTYGTSKTAGAQLLEDVSASMSLKPPKQAKIAYQPRPDLVRTGASQLPVPQETANKQGGVWPESPEQKRARLRQLATDNQDNALFEPVIVNDLPTGNLQSSNVVGKTPAQISADVKARRALQAGGSPTVRKHLSEPPIEYRAPVESAAYGDLGEDEAKKERRLRAEAKKKKGTGGLKGLIPWL
jgi:hypothetical protein